MHGHDVCTRRHKPAHACRVPKTIKGKFSALKNEVWNESHII